MVRIKVDQDLPRAAVEMLRERGHEAVSVVDQEMGAIKTRPCGALCRPRIDSRSQRTKGLLTYVPTHRERTRGFCYCARTKMESGRSLSC
jgi:hypothetical protein